jgi:hypothetical protein
MFFRTHAESAFAHDDRACVRSGVLHPLA